jgi:hypothetical protein
MSQTYAGVKILMVKFYQNLDRTSNIMSGRMTTIRFVCSEDFSPDH